MFYIASILRIFILKIWAYFDKGISNLLSKYGFLIKTLQQKERIITEKEKLYIKLKFSIFKIPLSIILFENKFQK
jgi:hypothetical protein